MTKCNWQKNKEYKIKHQANFSSGIQFVHV